MEVPKIANTHKTRVQLRLYPCKRFFGVVLSDSYAIKLLVIILSLGGGERYR